MEASFGKKLASTGIRQVLFRACCVWFLEQDVRDKAIKTLRKWLKIEGGKLSFEEFLRLWKGLFYSTHSEVSFQLA